jgi:hypothetical protein
MSKKLSKKIIYKDEIIEATNNGENVCSIIIRR